MSKSIVVCCDGTANEFSKARTNVAKIYSVLPKSAPDQVNYYHPGVGTMAPPGFVTRQGERVAEVLGMAFGYGLANDVRDAYVFLAQTFQPGDRVFMFGFSRGAYTVRALASLLYMYGLVAPFNTGLVPYAVRMLWAIRRLRIQDPASAARGNAVSDYFRLAAEFKATFSTECKPYFLGLWDTVSSVGWFTSPVSLPYTASNPDIAVARHALSIDERRAFFRPNVWRPKPDGGPRDLRQVWFPGVHGDVGGGYEESASGLSKFPLGWMISEAVEHGLRVDHPTVDKVLGRCGKPFAAPDADAPMHDSLSSAWKPLELLPLPKWDATKGTRTWRTNDGAPRRLPRQAIVHDVAWLRGGGRYAERLPTHAVPLSQATW
ncbi:DUF2235 domain-containing protein [Lichenihabitans sp. Uapishka_5]|uniref:DUF2235 domain-containing protein n=1 Tax=Lichenihabitans sp. Uapishka_5 TaxID=3037302 RepID=UPI0029E7D565|nr:DUF2235 domain-containing protein [Lichenihabitans sp. Uapishka_5]MDX7952437.1 DUF2235 domain-containing protein [Lichenihabitans sp. Uapishka_5]